MARGAARLASFGRVTCTRVSAGAHPLDARAVDASTPASRRDLLRMTSAVLASARGVPAPRPRRRPPVLGVSRGASRSAPPPIPPSPLPPPSSIPRRVALAGILAAIPLPGRSPLARAAQPPTPDPLADAADLARLAALEPDPEVAIDAWDEVVRLAEAARTPPTPTVASWLAARADVLAALRRWPEAERAYADAADALVSSGASASSPAGAAALALAYDCRGLALGAAGDWNAAVDASRRALATAGSAGLAREGLDVPTTAPAAGLIGGAPTVAQRLAFHAAMARWGAGDVAAAAAALDRLDVGPEPEPGFPQFWEARAALAAALWASGAKPRAEAEWAALCRGAKPNPPAVPTNGVKAAVNKAAQMQFDGYGVLMDKRCEDFSTGTPLPCDDAGIPGAGGSSAPCRLFTAEETKNRLWPPAATEALEGFLRDGPEYVLRASEMARG